MEDEKNVAIPMRGSSIRVLQMLLVTVKKISVAFVSVLVASFFVAAITYGVLLCAGNILSSEKDLSFGFAMVGAAYFALYVALPASVPITIFFYKRLTGIIENSNIRVVQLLSLWLNIDLFKISIFTAILFLCKKIFFIVISVSVSMLYVLILLIVVRYAVMLVDMQSKIISIIGWALMLIDWILVGLAFPLAMFIYKKLTGYRRKNV